MKKKKYSISDIVFNAMTIFERQNVGVATGKNIDCEFIDLIIKKWVNISTEGNVNAFERRLSWDGLDTYQVADILKLSPPNIMEVPEWAITLEQLFDYLTSGAYEKDLSSDRIYSQKIVPFEDVYFPLISFSRKHLLTRFGVSSVNELSSLYPFTISAYLDFEHELLNQMSWLSGEVIYERFSFFRPIKWSIEGLSGPISASGSKYYSKFVSHFNFIELIEEYPVLGRLIATSISNWIDRTYQLFKRTQLDIEQIKDLLVAPLDEPLMIQKVHLSLSDLHHHGQSVSIFRFNNGDRVVYKPRNLHMDVAFEKLIEWCNAGLTNSLSLRAPKVITRMNYGWVEHIEFKECNDKSAVSKHYERVGMLLCLVYILGGNDFHHENLIASGEHPILLDFESLLHHRSNLFDKSLEKSLADSKMETLFWDSVLRTGLLPQWIYDKDGNNQTIYDVSGLGGIEPHPLLEKQLDWEAINTDSMRIVYIDATTDIRENRVMCNGDLQFPEDFVSEIISGFSMMYEFFSIHKIWLVESEESPLRFFKAAVSRFIFRQTQVYSFVRSRCLLPENLKSGLDFGIELDLLVKPYLFSKNKNFAWELFNYEVAEMCNLDIPHLSVNVDSDLLILGNGVTVTGLIQMPSFSQMKERISKLCLSGLDRQIQHIKSALYAHKIIVSSNPRNYVSEDYKVGDLTSSKTFIDEATKIHDVLMNSNIRGDDGSLTWIGLTPIVGFNRFQYQPVGWDMYSGIMGMVTFLAAFSQIKNDVNLKNTIIDSVKPLQRGIHDDKTSIRQVFLREVSYGGFAGIASIIYGLCKLGQFLDIPEFLEDALLLSESITSEEIQLDVYMDLVNGTAGVLAGLTSLYSATNSKTVLKKAISCGDALLSNQLATNNNGYYRAWIVSGESKPLAGISHGAAGISLSLMKLFGITGNEKYLKAAIEGIQYENTLFDSRKMNWLDLRRNANNAGEQMFASTWCNGAPGIGLARLDCYRIYKDDQLLLDAQRSIKFILNEPISSIDHLCCGNFGRLETLRVASLVLGEQEHINNAKRYASILINKAEKLEGYQTLENFPPKVFSPGLFQGISGIGYEFLCLAHPELPSILLFN